MSKYLMLSAAAMALAFAAPAAAKGTISTYKSWDGHSAFFYFGCGYSTTYGQVITIPDGQTHLDEFHFTWFGETRHRMFVRGEVYAWDGSKATGSALYESKRRRIRLILPQNVVFGGTSVPVTPGNQYVIFASIDKDYESCTKPTPVRWGAIPSGDAYPGGMFVYQNNKGDEERWTTVPWNTNGRSDLAFEVHFP